MMTYTASDIAKYFLAKAESEDGGDLISNMKLQKLCYYAQGVGLIARGGNPLFKDKIEAWLHGPVVPSLYGEYKAHGRDAIPPPKDFDPEKYAPEDRMILDDVFDYYGQYTAWRLREMTHAEPPWKDAYAEAENSVITPAALEKYFEDQVDADYRSKYEQISRGDAKKG